MMSSTDSGLPESLCTPKRVQKRLFSLNVSSSKRNLFQTQSIVPIVHQTPASSGDESDLGPMSPLELSDSYDSSPGRKYDSPFTTPDNSPRSNLIWDRLRHSSQKKSEFSPFSSLRKITKDARATPGRRIFDSPKSVPDTPSRKNQENIIPNKLKSPRQTGLNENDIVPETPQKDTDSPQKDFSERRLITPLGSVCKQITIPPLHRRKSICPFESNEELSSSPEPKDGKAGKRHSSDSHHGVSKLMKADDFIPKARASLFQEEKSLSFAPLNVKSFYNNNNDEPKRVSFGFGWRPVEKDTKKRHSLPVIYRRSSGGKRAKLGQMNAGVKHGIRKPKLKRRHNDSFETKPKSPTANSIHVNKAAKVQNSEEFKENNMPMETANVSHVTFYTKVERTQPIVQDPSKKFFKSNRAVKIQNVANITVNNSIKLKVSDGKITREHKKGQGTHVNKKPKLDPVVFDTADLNVDDFEVVNDKEVASLLKVLEDDWADDDFDSMEALTSNRSPMKSLPMNDVLMSPASVLSNMTSSMNIVDQSNVRNMQENSNIQSQGSLSQENVNEKKLFPIFSNDHTSNSNIFEDVEKKERRGIKRPHGWQLSSKASDSTQYQLDVGQKRFGSTQCPECNIIYQIGEPEDENAHLIFHNNVKKLKFNGWKNEHVVYEDVFTRSRIITVEKTDSKHCWNKVEEILGIVDADLGLTDVTIPDHSNKRVYLYIRDKNIVGVLVSEAITIAHRMIPELIDLNCCEEEAVSAKCGVNVIWTALSHRRQGIAKKLMNILRLHFYFGYILNIDDIAFSIPTPTGKIFAEKYMGNKKFKVYS